MRAQTKLENRPGMPKILSYRGGGIYIYSESHSPHHLPHCHVRLSGGGDIIVSLPTLEIIVGNALTRDVKKFLVDNLDALIRAWDELNPSAK